MLILALIVGGLVAAGVAGQYYKFFIGNDPFLIKIVDKLDLDAESNSLPNWYQSSTLLLSAFILAIITLYRRAEKDPDHRYWGFLSVVFVYLSLDEMVTLHEQATMPLRHLFHFEGLLYLSWVVPAGIAVSIFFLLYLGFLRRLDAGTRIRLITAGAIYLFGAVGVEMLNGKYLGMYETEILGEQITNRIAFNYALMTVVEEFFEMAGILVFIHALLSYLRPLTGAPAAAAEPERAAPRRNDIGEAMAANLQITGKEV